MNEKNWSLWRHARGNPVQAVQAAGHPAGGVGGGPTITPHALWQSEENADQ